MPLRTVIIEEIILHMYFLLYRMTRDTTVNNVQRRGIPEEKFLRTWPHVFNSALAYLGCTLGLLNIDRFATLSMQFGGMF